MSATQKPPSAQLPNAQSILGTRLKATFHLIGCMSQSIFSSEFYHRLNCYVYLYQNIAHRCSIHPHSIDACVVFRCGWLCKESGCI